MPKYRAIVGGNYDPTHRRFEEGEFLEDLTPREVKDLTNAGIIEKVEDGS